MRDQRFDLGVGDADFREVGIVERERQTGCSFQQFQSLLRFEAIEPTCASIENTSLRLAACSTRHASSSQLLAKDVERGSAGKWTPGSAVTWPHSQIEAKSSVRRYRSRALRRRLASGWFGAKDTKSAAVCKKTSAARKPGRAVCRAIHEPIDPIF